MLVTIHAAKTNLSRLIEAAVNGEEVVIARGKEPVVRLVPVVKTAFRIGLLKDELTGPGPNFFEPLGPEDADLWEGAE